MYPSTSRSQRTTKTNADSKAAHQAVLINRGVSHTVVWNVFLDGSAGIYNTCASPDNASRAIRKFDSGELKRGDKGERIWHTKRVVGEKGWDKPPYSRKYPSFKKFMKMNYENTQFCAGWGSNNVMDIRKVPYVGVKGNREISLDSFVEAEQMNFAFKEKGRLDWARDIPFGQMGLTLTSSTALRPKRRRIEMP